MLVRICSLRCTKRTKRRLGNN